MIIKNISFILFILIINTGISFSDEFNDDIRIFKDQDNLFCAAFDIDCNDDNFQKQWRNYNSDKESKAWALTYDGSNFSNPAWGWSSNDYSEKKAKENAIKACNKYKYAEEECIIVLVDNRVENLFLIEQIKPQLMPTFENKFVCARATTLDGLTWETSNSKYSTYVNEAYRRNLSLKDCSKLTGRDSVKQIAQTPITKVDNVAPVLKIQDRITVTDRTYSITGIVSDASDVFIEVDGITVPVKNDKFTLTGSSSVGLKEYKIVAFDQWGNETKKTILVERIIQTVNQENKLELLDPEKLRAKSNKNRIALIIGIEQYENISNANYAKRDAQLFIDYVESAFGVPQNNIKYLFNENAKEKSKFDIKRWLKKNVRKNTEVYVYFSGHGMALNNGQDLYLLTNDTQPDFVEETAFSRNEIFNDIAKYNPKSVIAFLDTCYSGAGRADGEMLLAMAKGLVVVNENRQQLPDNFTLFTAASAQESAWSLPEAKHGTFSYFLMKGMEGEADLDGNKKITNGELQEYLLDNVSRYAQQQQTPQMIGDPDQVLVRF